MDTANDNFNPSLRPSTFDSEPSFMGAFGVFFTAVTGIVAGANLSGDLKDPSYSIPKGTLLAIAGTYVTWNTEHKATGKCNFGSGQNQMTMTYISFTGWLRSFGGFSASLSSAIASMVGAPRILQAVGKDGIYPGVKFFA